MKNFNTGRVQDKLINRLERQEKQQSFQRDKFFRYKLTEMQAALTQALLMDEIIETENPTIVSDLMLKGLKKLQKTNEFDYKYFTAPIRELVPSPNQISLYMTQYILEVVINAPGIIEIYGTDLDIYKVVNKVIVNINQKFERTEKKIIEQLSHNKSLIPGSRDYDIALDQLFNKAMGEPHE
ncbi:MAG: DUF507 family protein [Deltaproteobacteria bacterium]|nr:DUF507 family protein [Deltaproteobacteria bacterium]